MKTKFLHRFFSMILAVVLMISSIDITVYAETTSAEEISESQENVEEIIQPGEHVHQLLFEKKDDVHHTVSCETCDYSEQKEHEYEEGVCTYCSSLKVIKNYSQTETVCEYTFLLEAGEGVLSEDAKARIQEFSLEENEDILKLVEEEVEENQKIERAVGFDISFWCDEIEVSPESGVVSVQIQLITELSEILKETSFVKVFHVDDDLNISEAESVLEEDILSFDVVKSSKYVIAVLVNEENKDEVEVSPQPTPEETPQPTPEETPQPTPEETPQPTPEESPQPTPEESSQPTPEVSLFAEPVYEEQIISEVAIPAVTSEDLDEITYKLIFKLSGGLFNRMDSTVYEIKDGETVNEALSDMYEELGISGIETPSRTGYEFMGWGDSLAGGNVFDFNAALTEDTYVYAQWEAKSKVAEPVADIETGSSVKEDAVIKLRSSTLDAKIYYTTDGTEPSADKNAGRRLYTDGIKVGKIMTGDTEKRVIIKAYAVKEGSADSETVTFEYAVTLESMEWGDIADEDKILYATESMPDGDASRVPAGMWIAGINESGYTYSGYNITFVPDTETEIRVYDGKKLLKLNQDYVISYKNNKNAYELKVGDEGYNASKAPSVIVTGKGNYSGSITRTFVINRADFSALNDSGSAMFKAADIVLAYNGKVQKGTTTVTYTNADGKLVTLNQKTDFTYTYPYTDAKAEDYDANAFKTANEVPYEILITGKGNYKGELICLEKITSNTLISKAKIVSIPAQNYTGEEIKPVVTLTYNKTTLVEYNEETGEGDYTVQYENNVNVGTASVIITGKGAFAGKHTVTFKINGTALSKAKMTGFTSSYIYTGDEIVQDNVKFSYTTGKGENAVTTELAENRDYTVEYTNNVKAGTATVVYTGINAWTGTVKKTYKITAYDINKDAENRITITDVEGNAYPQELVYVKGGVKPSPIVKYTSPEGMTYILAEGVDYTLSYLNNAALNDGTNAKKIPTIKIVGRGSFSGIRQKETFTIAGADISELTITPADKVYTNRKGNFLTSVVITDRDGKSLKEGTDYEKSYRYYYYQETKLADGTTRKAGEEVTSSDIVPVGTVLTMEVTGKGIYAGEGEKAATISGNYRIVGADMGRATIKVNTQYYTGKEICPDKSQIVITLNGKVLAAQDYEIVSYSNNINKGTAKITVKGVGDYGGSKAANFTIANKSMYYMLSFNANGATSGSMRDMQLTYGKNYTLTNNAYKRTNYVFTGWNTEPDGTGTDAEGNVIVYENKAVNPVVINQEDIGKTLILYAQWEPVEYTITYHLNGGVNHVLNTKNSYTAEDENFTIYAPEREDWPHGYQFGGWYKENTYKNKISIVKTGSYGNLDLYEKWIPYTYTVNFDINVPSEEIETKKASGSMNAEVFSFGVPKALNANKFKRAGWAFAGWALDKNAELPEYTDKQTIHSDLLSRRNNINGKVTLYAVWRNEFNIAYETDGGVINGEYISSYVYTNKVYDLPQSVIKEGYRFDGWYKDAALKSRIRNIPKNNTGDLHLYAKWTPLNYKITYNGNGQNSGSMKTMSAKYDTPITLTKNTFVKKGYKHVGWSLTKDGSVIYNDEEVVNILPSQSNETITLYAVWEETDYKIIYNTCGGSIANVEEEVEGSVYSSRYSYSTTQDYELPKPVRDRYDFAGWYKDATFRTGVNSIAKGSFGDTTLYAKWTLKSEVKDFFVTYEVNGGLIDELNDNNYRTGYTYSETEAYGLPIPKKEGYIFAGWYKDSSFRSRISNIPKKSKGDLILYAKWTGRNYKITFDANAPEGTKVQGRTGTQTLTYGSEKALNGNGFKVTGYTFKGWSTGSYGNVEFENKQKITGVESVNWDGYAGERTLYAVWEKDVYGIIYNNMAGINNPNPDSYTVDDTIVLKEPEIMGNTFLGWYTDAGCRRKATSITAGSTGTKTLYAKWAYTQYTLCYDLNCKDDSVVMDTTQVGYVTSYAGNEEIGYRLPTATREGYLFGGWYKEAKCKTAVGPIISSPNIDMTVYAKWTPIIYQIHFEKNGEDVSGTMKDMKSLKYGTNYALTNNSYKRAGYTFEGWNTEADGSGISYGNREVIHNLTSQPETISLYAGWIPVPYNITYNLNGGSNHELNPATYTIEDGEIELREPTKEGHAFLGWYTDSKFSEGKKITVIAEDAVGDKVLYAKWKVTVIGEVTMPDEYLNVCDFGATIDDSTDDTEAFEDAIEQASENAAIGGINTVYVPAGTYMIKPGDANNDGHPGIGLESNVNLIMDNNAILQVMSTSLYDYCVMSGKNVENITITGGKIVGERYIHQGTYGEWGHGIALYGSRNITISNMTVSGNWGDGFYLGTQAVRQPDDTQRYMGCENIEILNCEIFDNRRSNISITDADDLTIERCIIYDAHGTAPQCGIYIEPNSNSSDDKICRDIVIKDTTISAYQNRNDAEYMCYMTHYDPYNASYVTADNVRFINCMLKGFVGNYSGTNLHMENTVITGTFINKK